ncbi:hypothetical protein D3C76_875380 [compost metagenome]
MPHGLNERGGKTLNIQLAGLSPLGQRVGEILEGIGTNPLHSAVQVHRRLSLGGKAADESGGAVLLQLVEVVVIALLHLQALGQRILEGILFLLIDRLADLFGIALLEQFGHLILVVLLDRHHFQSPLPHLIAVVGIAKVNIQPALINLQLMLHRGFKLSYRLGIFVRLLQLLQAIELSGKLLQLFLALLAQSLEVARFELKLELGDLCRILALVGLSVD